MARPLVDLASLNLTEDVMSEEELRSLIIHDYEFRLIDGVCHLDLEEGVVVGYKDWDENAWWARGHVPGRPILPGILMIEGAAQVATILMKHTQPAWEGKFVGMTGIDRARFRRVVTPPVRVHYVAKVGVHSTRIAKYPCECYAGTELAFDMLLLGMPI